MAAAKAGDDRQELQSFFGVEAGDEAVGVIVG